MRVVRAWFGYDSYGRSVEVAERSDGQFFRRALEFNGFGKAWTKWLPTTPSFETHTTNRYTDELVAYDVPQLFWGFNRLNELTDVPKYRLPKSEENQ